MKKQPESPPKNLVKLYVYELMGETVVIDKIEGKAYDDFVIVTVKNYEDFSEEDMASVAKQFNEKLNKIVLFTTEAAELAFYGLEEEDESRPTSGQLQHEEEAEEAPDEAEQ